MRPGAIEFLEDLHKHYEIVIFTAAMKDVNKFLIFSMQIAF
jgi:TFIIF-interacting CTD phosphatase-like protein